jgi:DnaJ-class molecular chaperone
LDAQILAELDRPLRLADQGDFVALLGLEPGAPESERKSSYRELVGKFHFDKFASSDEVIHTKLSRLCAAACEGLTPLAKPPEQRRLSEAGSEGNTNGSDSGFDKRRYDRELRAFDCHDFWDAIRLACQAIEVDDQQADFFALMGWSLMRHKKWRKEAADTFRRAS